MAEPACRPHEGGTSVHVVFAPRSAEVRPFRGGAVRKGSMASLATCAASPVIALIGVGVRREQATTGHHRERKEKEKYDACHSIASPDTLVHVSPFTRFDFSPAHRLHPFFQNFLRGRTVHRRKDPGPKPIGCRVIEFYFCRNEFR
jgi:hypothetical protein